MSKRHRRVRALPGDSTAVLKRQLPNLQALLRQARQDPPPCLLCGAPVGVGATVYTFTPDDKAMWGIPGWALASCVDTLCTTCQGVEDVHSRVLAVFWQERRQERARVVARWN